MENFREFLRNEQALSRFGRNKQALSLFAQNKRNLASLLILVFLALALPIGVYLMQQQQTYRSSAAGELIQLIESPCVQTINGKKTAICNTISVKLLNPFATSSGTTSPSPTSATSPNPSPTSQNPSPSPSPSVGPPRTVRVSAFNGTAIQTALDSIKLSGGAVYLPGGTYTINKKIRLYSNTTLFGDGMDVTHLTFASGVSDDMVANDSSNGQQNIVIRDLSLDGPGPQNYNSSNCCNGVPYGLKLENLNNAFVVNVSVDNFPSHGLYIGYKIKSGLPQGVKNTRITGCRANNNGAVGIYLVETDNVVVDNCTVQNNGSIQPIDGITLGPDNGAVVQNSKILGNKVVNNKGNGIGLASCQEAHKDAPVHNIAVCNNNVNPNDYAGLRQHKCNAGVYGNIFINNNDGGEFDNTGNGEILTSPQSACDIPAIFNIPAAPSKPAAMKIDTSFPLWGFISNLFSQSLIKNVYALGLAPELANSPYKEKLVSYWKFDEASGNAVADTNFQSANGTGTATNTTIVEGKFGKARSIPANGGISIPNIGEFGDNVMSIAGWIKPTTTPAGASIWNQPEGTSLEYAPEGDGTIQCVIKPIRENAESTFSIKSSGSQKVALNSWNHVACTFDMSTLNLYINGQLAASGAKSGWVNQPRVAQAVSIGKNIATGASINGAVDDLAYWNRALTAAEVASIYNGGQGKAIDLSSANVQTSPSPSPSSRGAASSPTPASSVQVSPPPAGTSYRLAETQSGLAQSQWVSYTTSPVVTSFTVSSAPGPKQVWVEFRSAAGQTITDHLPAFDLLAPYPVISGLNCTLDLTNKNLKITVTGTNLGSQKGVLTANNTTLETASWDDKTIVGLLSTTSAQTGQKYNVLVKRPDTLLSQLQSCQVNTSTISLGARVFCRSEGQFDVSGVKVTIASFDTPEEKVEETVTIDKDGVIQGIKTKLQSGQQYIISAKAPNTLRRNTTLTAQDGTTVANTSDGKPFILPIGDIAPSTPDGQINGLDRAELVKQWRILDSSSSGVLTGDFNRDKKVNSIDWACMKYDFGSKDDALGSSGSTYTRGINFSTGQGSIIFTTP